MSRTQSRNWHVTAAACPRIGAAWAAQAPMADHVRPSTGARCVSSARRDLCGGERGNLPPYRDNERFRCVRCYPTEADGASLGRAAPAAIQGRYRPSWTRPPHLRRISLPTRVWERPDALDRFDDALPLFMRSLGIWEKALGSEHPNVAINLAGAAGGIPPSTPRHLPTISSRKIRS